jgi:hypothetical protein
MTDSEPPLTELQIRMLRMGVFRIDGWCSWASKDAAGGLLERGFITCRDVGSDEAQYTCFRCVVTDKGKAAIE